MKTISNHVSETWNKTETLDRLGGDEELLRELIAIFAEESPKLLQRLEDAISSASADEVMRVAHSIKGEVGCLGAIAATNTACKLEYMGRDQKLAGATEAFADLQRELIALKIILLQSVTND